MNKKSTFGKVIKIFTAIIAAVLILAIGAVLALRFAILPRISQKLHSSGKDDLAAIVEQNNNLSAFAKFGKLLTDRGMLKFVASLDGNSSSSVVDFMETITEENPSEEVPSSDEQTAVSGTPWKVDEARHIPRSTPNPTPAPTPVPKPTPAPSVSHNATTAYERIAAVATEQDMADGLAIIAKLDMGYVASLVADGLTSAEKAELKRYVYSKLTKAEVSRSIALYNKYKKYL